jgi:hypothetical protein
MLMEDKMQPEPWEPVHLLMGERLLPQEEVEILAKQQAAEFLESCNTHRLLAMLASSRLHAYEGPGQELIKAELSRRPHVTGAVERRAKLYRLEKGDARRVRQRRRKM